MTPQLRFPEFTDEWQVKKIGDTGNVITGSTPVTADRTLYGSEYQFISPGDMNSGRYVISTKQRLSQKGFDISRKIKTGSTLFVCIGSTIGKTAQVREMSVTNQQINAVETNDNHDDDFVYLALSKISTKIALSAGAQAVPIISKSDFSKNIIHIPSKPEQEKIADFLTAVDERIAVGEKKLELLETYKRGVMQKIFSQQIRFKDENGSPYPDWEEKKLESLLVKNKKRNKNLEINYVQSVSNARGFVSQNDYFDGANIASKNTSNYFIIEKSTFAYNPSRINVGSLAYKSDETTSIVSPLYVSFKTQTGLLDGFLLPWFSTELFKKQMNRSFEGSVRDTLSFEALSDMRLMLPNEQEQQKIADFLTTLDEKITAEKSKLTAARQFKKALLQRMFV